MNVKTERGVRRKLTITHYTADTNAHANNFQRNIRRINWKILSRMKKKI